MARKNCERGEHVCRIWPFLSSQVKNFGQYWRIEASQSGRFYLVFFIGEMWKQIQVLLFILQSTLTIKILNSKQSFHQNHQRLVCVATIKMYFSAQFWTQKKTQPLTGKNKSFVFHKIENSNCQSGKCNWLISYGQNVLKLFINLNNTALLYCSQQKKNQQSNNNSD